MTTWPTVRLGTLADFKNGLNFPGTSWGKGLKIIGVSDFGDRSFPDYSSLEEVNPQGIVRDVDLLSEGDILFVRSNGNRELIGRSLLIKDMPEPLSHSGFTIRLRFRPEAPVCTRFYSYVFKSDIIRKTLSGGGGGTNINNLNQGLLGNLEVPVPPQGEQEAIAALLASYDDLIANNQRRIALLESMAEEIYREWFVRMRFPGYAKIERQGLQPEGWTRQPIGELAALVKRGISPAYDDQSPHKVINQKCIRNGRLSMQESRNHSTVTPDEKLIHYGDVLINSTGVGTLGRSAVFDLKLEGVTCDSHVTILRPKGETDVGEFLAYSIQFLQIYFESMASGSTGQAELSRELISQTKLLVPTAELLKAFTDKVRPIRQQRRVLLEQTDKLAQMREQLLPRLISGKLRIDHLDIQFPPSMKVEQAQAA